MSHYLQRINSELQDNHFWQILVTCSHDELFTHGESFLAHMEEFSPGMRIIFNFTCKPQKAVEFLREKLIYNSVIYTIRSKRNSEPILNSAAASKWLLRSTLQPVLVMNIRTSCKQDLNFLPVDLHNADISTWTGKDGKGPYVTWLHSNWQTKRFVGKHSRSLETILTDGWSENSTSHGKNNKNNNLAKFSQFPDYYEFDVEAPSKKLVRPDIIILAQKQDVGTKHLLKRNEFLMRAERLSRPNRVAWRLFPNIIAQYEQSQKQTCKIIPIPHWEITELFVEKFIDYKKVYAPHLRRSQIDLPNVIFYMQEYLSQIFTTGKNGWGPEGDAYQSTEYLRHNIDPKYREFKSNFAISRQTRADQGHKNIKHLSLFDLLIPLQVPDDEALSNFGNCGQENLVDLISKFAQSSQLTVLFRKHPHDHSKFFMRMSARYSGTFVKFSIHGHIHDVIRKSKAVVVINSGVGFEAMLLNKPVIAFGKAIYDAVVTTATAETIGASIHQALDENPQTRLNRYDLFLSWFLFEFACKIDNSRLNFRDSETSVLTKLNNPHLDRWEHEACASISSFEGENHTNSRKADLSRHKKLHALNKSTFGLISKIWKYKNYGLTLANKRLKNHFLPKFDPSFLDGKRIALVGNASSLLDSCHGEEIDRHDIVIRLNLGYPLIVRDGIGAHQIPKEFLYGIFHDSRSVGQDPYPILRKNAPEELIDAHTHVCATGRRTDIWSCSTVDKSRQTFFAPLFNCRMIACHPNTQHISFGLLMKRRIEKLPPHITSELKRKLATDPTSGLIWIDFLMQTNLRELDLYGFDFSATGHVVRQSQNILVARNKFTHLPGVERDYVLNSVLPKDTRISLIKSARACCV
ncbi:glycosyltransferase family 29 protein [Pseudovibrio sp. Tun.PSC04-5.I4]|uniref:glycosyltransferase family 29 protein n=1 Tax=Pseudovibrio sp. Tun.PSC04-5.I4 TaxID=1798213 RepID=UPI0008925B9E|nr:glycosyltransferase family 29 protein [Pseudovibrio sp. Tun.PSC04-5.I4]SDQ20481.1 Glycosyltransferase family 29 (sialyltransferase) [Pseudovibrio sp. Tun.PSC04-5.I4]